MPARSFEDDSHRREDTPHRAAAPLALRRRAAHRVHLFELMPAVRTAVFVGRHSVHPHTCAAAPPHGWRGRRPIHYTLIVSPPGGCVKAAPRYNSGAPFERVRES